MTTSNILLPAVLLLNSTAAMNVCRREALPKASLLHVEPLVHYLTNLLPSMSIIAIEELVRMRYILWSLSLFLSNGWQHVFEDTAHC